MTSRPWVLATCLLVAVPGAAFAGGPAPGVHGGYSAPTGSARTIGDGFHLGFTLGYLESGNGFGIDANCHVLSERTTMPMPGIPILVTQKGLLYEAAFYVRARIAPKHLAVLPYFKGGFGLAHMKPDLTITGPSGSLHSTDSETRPELLAGIGVATNHSGPRLGIEVLLHQIYSDSRHDDLVTIALCIGASPPR